MTNIIAYDIFPLIYKKKEWKKKRKNKMDLLYKERKGKERQG